jgi:cation/acetate symporter
VRKAFGWAVLLTGFLLMTLLSLAGFMRGYLVQQVVGTAGDQLPLWFQTLEQSGAVATQTKTRIVTLEDLMVRRDAMVFSLPVAAGMMETLVRLAQAGGLAAALAAAGAHIVALGTIIADDLISGFRAHSLPAPRRIAVGRTGIGLGAAGVAVLAVFVADPLTVALAGITISAGGLFPVLALSIIWKRLSRAGAFAGLITGLIVTTALMVLSLLGQITMAPMMAAAVGGPLSFLIAGMVTRASTRPSKHMLEIVQDMRVPGGETVYDRILRQERRGRTPAQH